MEKKDKTKKAIENLFKLRIVKRNLIVDGLVKKEIYTFDESFSVSTINDIIQCLVNDIGRNFIDEFFEDSQAKTLESAEIKFADDLADLITELVKLVKKEFPKKIIEKSSLDLGKSLESSNLAKELNVEQKLFFERDGICNAIQEAVKKSFTFSKLYPEFLFKGRLKGKFNDQSIASNLQFKEEALDFLTRCFEFFSQKGDIKSSEDDFLKLFLNPEKKINSVHFKNLKELRFIVEQIFDRQLILEKHGNRRNIYKLFKNGRISTKEVLTQIDLDSRLESLEKNTSTSAKRRIIPSYEGDFNEFVRNSVKF